MMTRSAAVAPVSRSASGYSADLLTDPARFVGLESEWNDAVERAGIEHPFLCHEWLRTWWECFGEGRRLHIVIIRSGGRIAAIAPLMWETVVMYGLPVRRLSLLHNDHCPRSDFIVTEPDEELYRAIWTTIVERRSDWDVLQLGQLPEDSHTRAAFSRFAAEEGLAAGAWQSGDSPYIELTGTWDRYLGTRSSKLRQNVRNRLSRLKRIADPTLEVIDGGESILDACEEAVRLETSGWKERARSAICSDSAVHEFYRRIAGLTARRGWLRLLFLNLGGRHIAGSFSLRYRHRLFLCKTGYDPAYHTGSPFKVLMYLLLREAFAGDLIEVDLLGDPEPWKLEWTDAKRPHIWLFVFSNTRRARLLYPIKFRLVPALKRSRVVKLVRG
jgi:CelD/BcsL family acetyltransferase involved in cellulose biosynthesis